ncbi:MAG: imelysin family protein, partial [Polyangiales bacterium]
TINANGTWAALGAPELARRRADYAIAVADDLVAQAKSLVSAWAPGEGDYHTAFTQAGTDTRLYARDQDAFNVVDNALYYFDKELKDFKVGVPLGRNPECGAPSCPERVESRLSGASNANIAANIVGFRLIVQGCGAGFGGLGFDDWLRASQQPELADALTAAAANAEQVARTLPAPLETLVRTDPARAGLLYDALKAVSDLLKAELPSALNLEPPAAVAGDND